MDAATADPRPQPPPTVTPPQRLPSSPAAPTPREARTAPPPPPSDSDAPSAAPPPPAGDDDRDPSTEEDDALFLATGYRYLPARERGFPHPWCAKKSGSGWVVRDAPPPDRSRRRSEEGGRGADGGGGGGGGGASSSSQLFRGWRAAERMLRSREILLERVRNRERRRRERNGGRPPAAGIRGGEGSGPLKKRRAAPPNGDDKRSSRTIREGERAVDRWFRDTDAAVRSRQRQLDEEDLNSVIKKRKVELKQERTKKREEARLEKKRARIEAKIEARASKMMSEEKSRAKESVPSSPLRKKHKKATPTKKSIGSIMLGEDPQLDDMIAGIVDEFTHEFAREQDSDAQSERNSGAGSHIEFDGSAVSALREAARDTLATMTKQGAAVDRGASDAADDAAEGAKKRVDDHADSGPGHAAACCTDDDAGDAALPKATSAPANGKEQNAQCDENDSDPTDGRIADMIEQLIGEVAHDSGCRFDGRAVAALREAAREIVEDRVEVGPSENGNGRQVRKG